MGDGAKRKTEAVIARQDRPRAAKSPTPRAKKIAKRKPKPTQPVYGVAPPIADEATLTQAVAALRALDPEGIGHMLDVAGSPPLRAREPGYAGLAAIIVSQQVSVASADAMFGRLAAAFDPLDAAAIHAADETALRACGLSGGKARSLKAIASAILSGTLDIPALATIPAAQAHGPSVRSMALAHGPLTFSFCFACAIPMRGLPATLPYKKPHVSRSACASAPTPRNWHGSASGGAPIAASRHASCGLIIAW